MKTHVSIVIFFMLSVLNSKAQWNTSGDNASTGNLNIGGSLWVNSGAFISSDFSDNDPNYSWGYNLAVRNNNGSINTFSRLSFVSQSGGFGAISLLKTGDYTGDMYFQVRNGAGYYQTPLLIKANGYVGIGTGSPSAKLNVYDDGNPTRLIIGNPNTASGGFTSLQMGTSADSNGYSFISSIKNSGSEYGNLVINGDGGNVGIGTNAPNQKLTVKGTIYGTEVKVDLSVPGPDYVFENSYHLRSLEETKTYIDQNKHLPEVPSAKEMETNGINLSEMNMLLLKKVEELTLYAIEQKKAMEQLRSEVEMLKKTAKN